MQEAQYIVIVADYAAMRAINGDGMGGAAFIHNPLTGGWNQTALNGDWFSWYPNIVRNGSGTMLNELNPNIAINVLHQGPENGGRLEFAIPLSQLSLPSSVTVDANLVFAIWSNPAMAGTIRHAYLDTQSPVIPGNVSGSGRVSSADATMIARHVVNGTAINMRAADVNCDGVVDLADVTRLMRALVGHYPNGLCPNGGCIRC